MEAISKLGTDSMIGNEIEDRNGIRIAIAKNSFYAYAHETVGKFGRSANYERVTELTILSNNQANCRAAQTDRAGQAKIIIHVQVLYLAVCVRRHYRATRLDIAMVEPDCCQFLSNSRSIPSIKCSIIVQETSNVLELLLCSCECPWVAMIAHSLMTSILLDPRVCYKKE
ncbi:hypothetical protein EVAR_64227_1 [Eumeta japonica]|uniref:Uncharacterized protein n=1 Tax=Eumeta variegata TaxID=151549 RepID=A0A4C1ZRT5_EUMVA|nr:hypothetical protein EVAR_64227_1 [Eumeta japonica]